MIFASLWRARTIWETGDRSADEIANDLWALHETALGETMAIGIPPSKMQLLEPRLRHKCQAVNADLECRASQATKTSYLPCPLPYSDTSEHWEPDGLHMTEQGYMALGTAIAPFLRDRLIGTTVVPPTEDITK